jgi:hypothetical protein
MQHETRSINWTAIIIAALGCSSVAVTVISVTAILNGYRVKVKVDGKLKTLEFNTQFELTN